MYPSKKYLLIALTGFPLLSVGCSSVQHLLTRRNQPAAQVAQDEASSATTSPSDPSPSPEIQTVVFSEPSTNGPVADPTGSAAELITPIDVDQVTSRTELTLHAIEQLALAGNPAIQQASSASARAQGIRTQVGLRPNPTIGYNGTQLADAGTDQHTAFFGQTFVRGDKLAWNREVIGHDVNAANWQVETQRYRVLTDVRRAFYRALAAQKRLQLAQEFREIAAKGVEVSEAQVEARIGTRPDVLQSEIQLNEVDLTIQQAEFQLQAALNELEALCGGANFDHALLVGELQHAVSVSDMETVYSQIVTASPLLAAAQARVDRARANIQRQQVQAVPNVNAQLGAGYDNGTGQGLINLQVDVPVPIRNRNQGNIQAAHAEYCNAIKNVERLRMNLRQQLAEVMRSYNGAEATVVRYEQSILPKAEETLKLMQQAQAAGEFDFLRVLTARRAYFDANLRYVTALAELAQAKAQIDGLLLSGGLNEAVSYDGTDELRGQALGGE